MANPITQVEVGGTTYDVKDAGAVRSVNNASPDANGNVNVSVGVKTINGEAPDEAGNIEIQAGGGSGTVVLATIGTSWTENDDGTKSQTVSLSDVTADNNAQVDTYYNDGEYADYVEAQNQFLEFITNGFAKTVAGGITFTIFGEANTVSIPIIVEVI